MKWGELKELAIEAEIDDEMDIEFSIDEDDLIEDVVAIVVDNTWVIE